MERMTNEQLDAFLELLMIEGWKIQLREPCDGNLNESFYRRYPRIPEDYTKFLQRVASCVNADDTVWFCCTDDYNGTSPAAFAWDEFERMGLEGAREDAQKADQIREFWDQHLPFMLSVSGDYACLSLCVSGDAYGSVVDCYEPDFEGFSEVAATFDEFVRFYIAALKGDFGDTVLRDYV
jgi:SMI1 / KNR4 family (SUKH-1)